MIARFGSAALSAVLVLAAVPALGASPDSQFAMQAAQGGMAEVQMGRLAVSKTRNAVVRSFAQRMIADHTANNAQLAAIMRAEGLAVPTALDPNSQAMLTRLQSLSGRAFNRAYLTGQVRAHGQMQILMQAEVNGGRDPRLKAYARTTLSAVNMHLSMAKADLAKLGGASGNGSMSGGMSGGSMSGGSTSGGTTSGGTMPGGTTTPGGMTSPMPTGSTMPSSGSGTPSGGSMPSPAASSSPSAGGTTMNGNGALPTTPSPRPSPTM